MRATLSEVQSVERDTGLGTAYERWAIYRRLERWFGRCPPATALEGPCDGMAGLPGLHLLPLARRGTQVTVVLSEAAARERVQRVYDRAGLSERLVLREDLPEQPVELVLGFNFAPLVPAWEAHVAALAERASRHMVVFATHPSSYGVGLRLAMRKAESARGPELFEHPSCLPEVMKGVLGRHGDVVSNALVDLPWWPDLFVSAGETLLGASIGRLTRRRVEASSDNAASRTKWDAGPEELPFAQSNEPPGILRALGLHPHFEHSPEWIGRWFAHHRAYLVRRMDLGGGSEYA